MSTITAVQAPPQTVETLDPWGNTDTIAWSFDSAIWDTCGIYSLSIQNTASSSGELNGAYANRTVPMLGRSFSAATQDEQVSRGLECSDSAKSGVSASFVRIRTDVVPVVLTLSVDLHLWFIRTFTVEEIAAVSESVVFEYKGWNWEQLSIPSTEWAQMVRTTADWTQLGRENAEWRSVVQWQ